ncbi:MAG: penicillin acylase family protein [Chitinophagaceae bacterium]
MRVFPFIVSTVVTAGLVFALGKKWGPIPPMGKFLSPQHGFWQNAEATDESYNEQVKLPGLKGKAEVYFDERLVPHVFAEDDRDAYFIQGYLHARFRLWQMEFQIFAAGGRVSEVIGAGEGDKYLKYDRSMRRLGMVSAAEKVVQTTDTLPEIKAQMDAYTAGVNAWIDQLTEAQLPLEYKLLDYKPERWSNLKTALLVKYLSYDLAGHDDDAEYTNAKTIFSLTDFEQLYPVVQDSLKPIVPNSTDYPYPATAAVDLAKPAAADSLYFTYRHDTVTNLLPQPDKDNGSNDWAVAGSKTADGAPILCNDPHLGLNLPSIWYEMQLSTPAFNAYGVTFPGAPHVIIGFNDSIAFGVTNAGRDVKDYYEIRFRDKSMNEYWFDSSWVKAEKRVEPIRVRGQAMLQDTVVYTLFGPVIYDHTFPASPGNDKYYAVKWKANDPSNELQMFHYLNRAKNYDDFAAAIQYLTCPGQNPVFASRSGDIAIWQQGDFPAKWRRQGDFYMPGFDSSYLWKSLIPQQQNPHMKNPARGYVSSANQLATDSTYPYYLGNSFPVYRGYMVNRHLDAMSNITPADMERVQTDNYNVLAEFSKDILVQVNEGALAGDERKYFDIYKNWNFRSDPQEKGATVFYVWWKELENAIWRDEIDTSGGLELPWPNESTLVESLHKDSAYKFIDNTKTPQKETLADVLLSSLKKATATLKTAEGEGRLEWARYKGTKVQHLLKIPALSRLNVPIGGGPGIINAAKVDHGPSWRMVIHLSQATEAYGVYPGGQSGNPGSKYYDNFIDTWAKGAYYTLWFMDRADASDKRVKWTMQFEKG